MTEEQIRIRELLESAGFTPADAQRLAQDADPTALLSDLDDISYLEGAEQHEEINLPRLRPEEMN